MPDTTAGAVLTDGTGVSRFTGSKLVKDFVADLLLSGSAALMAVQIVNVQAAAENPTVVTFALLGASIRVVYRQVLRWATS